MDRPQPLFDERVTMKKVDGYRAQVDDESSGNHSSGTYDEMVEEVERVSDMLMQTQSKLWASQDELKSWNNKAKVLQSTLDQRDHEMKRLRKENDELRKEENTLRHEVERLTREVQDRDEGRARPELERRLRKAIEFLKKDLDAANEKNQNAQKDILAQKKTIDELRNSNKTLEESFQERQSKAAISCDQLDTCQKQLREANEGNAILLEEVATLRDELSRTKKIADQKDVLIRREVEDSVKEKIKLEVSKSVTKQMTERVTREVTAKMKAERDKELNSLREQIRKIVKENVALQSKIDAAERMASEADALQQDVQVLTYEITRYESMIDEAKQEYEIRLAKLETDYRMNLQTVKEEAAKEKWAHASEIRKQMTAEREREVQNFTQRIEALSKQAERLLDRAEKEKNEYGMQVKKRTEEEMQREIKALSEKLDARTRESEQLSRDTKKDKDTYADQLRQSMEDEKQREINKYTYRIDVLVEENDNWKKRVQSFEDELAVAWQENKDYADQLKRCQSDIKCLEDENFKLKRKTQNFATLINRYKQDAEEATKELHEAKQLFRDALLKSEGQNLKLKTKLRKLEPKLNKDKNGESPDSSANATKILVDRIKLYERDNSYLLAQNEKMCKALSGRSKQNWSECESNDWILSIKSENARLRQKIMSLEALLRDAKNDDFAASDELLLAMEAESLQLKSSIDGMDAMFRKYRDELKKSSVLSQSDIFSLKEQLRSTDQLLEQYRVHRNDTTRELERARQMTEDALTMASEDDTVQLKHEIQTIERMLKMFNDTGKSIIKNGDKSVTFATGREKREGLERLQEELDSLGSALEESSNDISQRDQNDDNTEKSVYMEPVPVSKLRSELVEMKRINTELENRVEALNYVLEKYRGELSKASQDLDNTRQTLALEGETAQQLSRRVESLNLLLDTTEQNHAENCKELAQSRRLLQEAANASKCEIERLNEEINRLNQSLSRTQQEMSEAHKQSDDGKQEYLQRLEEAGNEILEWKRKFEQKVKENQQLRMKAEEEYEKSKRIHHEAIERTEKEINELNKIIDSLTQSNLEYAEESKIHESEKNDLRKALRESKLQKDEDLKKMEHLLRKAREGSKFLMKKMEESERNFQRALKKSEDERNELKKSLDDVKKTLLGQSFDESSADNSSRRMTRSIMPDTTSLHDFSNDLLNDNDNDDDSDANDSSSRIFARLDDLLGSKKKRVSWKDSEWDIDVSTVATLISHPSKIHASSETVSTLESVESSWTRDCHPERDESVMCDESESDNGKKASHDKRSSSTVQVAQTFEETIRWKRNKCSSKKEKGTSWDDLTNISIEGESREETPTFPTIADVNKVKVIKAEESKTGLLLSRSGRVRSEPVPNKKKSVTWRMNTDETRDNPSSDNESIDQHDSESREPLNDDSTDLFMTKNTDCRDESLEESMAITDSSAKSEITSTHSRLSNDGVDDDESSTLDWNIPHLEDSSESASDTSSVKQTTAAATTTTTTMVRHSEETSDAYFPGRLDQNLQATSFSSSFSYSTNESSSDNETDVQYFQDSSILTLSQESASVSMDAETDTRNPMPVVKRRQNKSGCQRAREKASRRNWTKEELNQFITRKKIGRIEQRRRPQTSYDQPNDDGAMNGSYEGEESRDASEIEGIESATLLTEE